MTKDQIISGLEPGWIFIQGTDYASALPHIKASGEDFHLIRTAFENRFWGDETMIKFINIEETECRLVNEKLFSDYALDWLFKNHKL